MKNLLLALIAALLVAGAAGVYIFWPRPAPTATDGTPLSSFGVNYNNQSTVETEPAQTQTQKNTVAISDVKGGTLYIKNFKTDPSVVEDSSNTGHYYFGYHYNTGASDTTSTDDPPYVIEYNEKTQFFSIALLKEPLKDNREAAQQFLAAHIGLPKVYLCRLKYTVSVPVRVNPIYTGTDVGFSYCPGAVQL